MWLIIDRLRTRVIGEGSGLRVRRALGERTIDLSKASTVRMRFPFPALIVKDNAGRRVAVPGVAWRQRYNPIHRQLANGRSWHRPVLATARPLKYDTTPTTTPSILN